MSIEELFIREIVRIHFNCNASEIIGIYQYGSRVYGTASEKSDWDFVVIINNSYVKDYAQYETEDFDIHLMTLNHYNKLLKSHDIMALECFYQKNPIMECKVYFELNLKALRKSISSVVNNSWSKTKKKMELKEESSYIGLKSLLHSFRILIFGISIAKFGMIDYTNCIDFWIELQKMFENTDNWEDFNKKYKQDHNILMTEFRKLAPKV